MKRILCLLLTLAPAAASADKNFASGKGGTWDCKKDPVVQIGVGNATFKIKGACDTINVGGGKNKITIENVTTLNVGGGHNDITVDAADAIIVGGSNNKVTWKKGKSGDSATVTDGGAKNTIAQAGAPATPPAANAPAAPVAAGGGSAIDCGKSPTFSTTDNNGSFTLTGKCDKIMISGNHNTLKVESVKSVSLTGNANTVDAVAVDAIDTPGNSNKVTYKKAVGAAKTKVMNPGNDNKISQVK